MSLETTLQTTPSKADTAASATPSQSTLLTREEAKRKLAMLDKAGMLKHPLANKTPDNPQAEAQNDIGNAKTCALDLDEPQNDIGNAKTCALDLDEPQNDIGNAETCALDLDEAQNDIGNAETCALVLDDNGNDIGNANTMILPTDADDQNDASAAQARSENQSRLLEEYKRRMRDAQSARQTTPSNHANNVPFAQTLPKEGATFVNNYEILKLLGQGGFGAVYHVKNLKLGRDEALKLILPESRELTAQSDMRFIREINVASRLEHPNIVRLYSAGCSPDGILWMTMQHIEGQRLDRIMQSGACQFEQAKNIVMQILNGLCEAHSRQMIHRDLKPSNILISNWRGFPEHVTILDFGLSKALGADEDQQIQELTCRSERIFGTPQYMAPEQIKRGIMGPWTDIYAIGLMLLELLTGKPAVTGKNATEIAISQLNKMPILPTNWTNTAIKKVILKAIQKDAQARYQNAWEMLFDLNAIQAINDPESVLPTLPTAAMKDDPNAESAARMTMIGQCLPCDTPKEFNRPSRTKRSQNTTPRSVAAIVWAILFGVTIIAIVTLYILGIINISI